MNETHFIPRSWLRPLLTTPSWSPPPRRSIPQPCTGTSPAPGAQRMGLLSSPGGEARSYQVRISPCVSAAGCLSTCMLPLNSPSRIRLCKNCLLSGDEHLLRGWPSSMSRVVNGEGWCRGAEYLAFPKQTSSESAESVCTCVLFVIYSRMTK